MVVMSVDIIDLFFSAKQLIRARYGIDGMSSLFIEGGRAGVACYVQTQLLKEVILLPSSTL